MLAGSGGSARCVGQQQQPPESTRCVFHGYDSQAFTPQPFCEVAKSYRRVLAARVTGRMKPMLSFPDSDDEDDDMLFGGPLADPFNIMEE